MKNTLQRIVCALLLLALPAAFTGCKARDYKAAAALYENGEYEAAMEAFAPLSDYKDSAEMIDSCIYELGKKAFDENDYKTCLFYFTQLPENENAKNGIHKILFQLITGDFQSHLTDATNHFTSYVKTEMNRMKIWVSGLIFSGGESTFEWDLNNKDFSALLSDEKKIQKDIDGINALYDEKTLSVCDSAVKQAVSKANAVADEAADLFTMQNVLNYITATISPALGTSSQTEPYTSPESFTVKISELESAANALK